MKKMKIQSLTLLLSLVLILSAFPVALAAEEAFSGVNAAAGLLVDVQYDTILYEKNAQSKRYPASITKVMTALLVIEALERGDLQTDTLLTCKSTSLEDITWDSSTQNIKVGEQMSVEELLYCLLCASANEAGNILAEGVSGSIPAFVEAMNTRAQELGMTNTHFVNPHGLHNNDHYSTAYDIYLMTREAMRYPLFQKIVGTADHTVPATNMSDARRFFNTNALLSNWQYTGYTYSAATGVKTGHTGEAGYCLVASAQSNGRTLISVVLGAENVIPPGGTVERRQFSESSKMLKWGFSNFKVHTLLGPGTLMSEVPVTLGKNVSYVLGGPAEIIETVLPIDLDPELVQTEVTLLRESVEAPVKQGQVLGSITVSYNGTVYGSSDLVAINDVERSILKLIGARIAAFFDHIIVRLALIALIIFIIFRYLHTSKRKPRRGNRKPPSNTTPYPGNPKPTNSQKRRR